MKPETRRGTWLFPRGRKQRTQARSAARAAQVEVDRALVAEGLDIEPGDLEHEHLWFHFRDFSSEYARADGHWACVVSGCEEALPPRTPLPAGELLWSRGGDFERSIALPEDPQVAPPTQAEWQSMSMFERRCLIGAVQVLSVGGTWCGAHGHLDEGCGSCSLPDLSRWLPQARAIIADGQKQRAGQP